MMAGMKTIFDILDEIWDEIIEYNFSCKHEECPYEDCMYHKYTTKPTYFYGEDIPFYMPKNEKEMKTCMSYLDI